MPSTPKGWLAYAAVVMSWYLSTFTPRYDYRESKDHRVDDSRETAISIIRLLERPRWAFDLQSIWKLKRPSLQGLAYRGIFQAGMSAAGIRSIKPAATIVDEYAAALRAEGEDCGTMLLPCGNCQLMQSASYEQPAMGRSRDGR